MIFTVGLLAQNIKPYVIAQTSGSVTDFVIDNNLLYAATDEGKIDIIDIESGECTKQIKVPPTHDFMGDEIPSKIYSVDKFNDKIVYVWQGHHGFRNISLKQNGVTTKIVDADEDKLLVKKIRFVDENHVLLGLLSNELILFNINNSKEIYRKQISAYSFSDFALNKARSKVVTADESGITHLIIVSTGNIVLSLQENNVDNIYQVDYKNGIIITAGQDRRVGIYNTVLSEAYYRQEDFLVYSASLSSDGKTGAFSASEDNYITLFDTESNSITATLKGHNSTITKIKILDNNTIVSSAEEPIIIIWKTK